MSVNFNPGMNMPKMVPDAYAKQYAQKNNMDIDSAKQELKAQFGDPSIAAAASAMGMGAMQNTQGVSSLSNDTTSIFSGNIKSEGPKNQGDPNPLGQIGGFDWVTGTNESKNEESGGLADTLKNLGTQALAFLKGNQGPQSPEDPNLRSEGPKQEGDPDLKNLEFLS